MEAKEEEQLVRACQGGDAAAFERLVEIYQDLVYGLAWQMLHDREEAEDVAQEVFVSAFRNIQRFRFQARFSTWLYRVTVNRVKNRWKYHQRRQRDRHESLDEARGPDDPRTIEPEETGPDPRQQAEGRQLGRILQQQMDELPEEYREVLVLRFVEGLSYEEIAEVLECSLGTVKSRINRGRRKLRENMRAYLD